MQSTPENYAWCARATRFTVSPAVSTHGAPSRPHLHKPASHLTSDRLSISVQKSTPLTTDHALLMCTASLSLKRLTYIHLLIEAILLNFIFMSRFKIRGRV